jgi:hypothetical protein
MNNFLDGLVRWMGLIELLGLFRLELGEYDDVGALLGMQLVDFHFDGGQSRHLRQHESADDTRCQVIHTLKTHLSVHSFDGFLQELSLGFSVLCVFRRLAMEIY